MKRRTHKRRRRTTRTLKMVRSRGAYTFAPMSGKRRTTRRKSGGGSFMGKLGISGVSSTVVATFAFWWLQSAANYAMKSMNIQAPKTQALVPGLIALLAYKGKLNIPGLLPVAVSQTLNTLRATTPALEGIANPFSGFNDQPRTYAQTVAAINRNAIGPQTAYSGIELANRAPGYSGLQLANRAPGYSGYKQI